LRDNAVDETVSAVVYNSYFTRRINDKTLFIDDESLTCDDNEGIVSANQALISPLISRSLFEIRGHITRGRTMSGMKTVLKTHSLIHSIET
jgi:hypothetical protein